MDGICALLRMLGLQCFLIDIAEGRHKTTTTTHRVPLPPLNSHAMIDAP